MRVFSAVVLGTLLQVTAASAATESSVFGYVDIRPSWRQAQGTFHSENEISAAYRLSPRTNLGYVQEVQSNIYSGAGDQNVGLNARLFDGYLKGEVNEIARPWGESELAYEGRIYAPLSAREEGRGHLTSIRNTLKLKQPIWGALSVTLAESPILHFFRNASYGPEGGLSANRWFENHARADFELSFFKEQLAVRLPIILQSFVHRTVADATDSGTWKHWVWINPEILWSIEENTMVGLSYYSEILFAEDLGQSQFGDGLKNGVTQLVFQQSF